MHIILADHPDHPEHLDHPNYPNYLDHPGHPTLTETEAETSLTGRRTRGPSLFLETTKRRAVVVEDSASFKNNIIESYFLYLF